MIKKIVDIFIKLILQNQSPERAIFL